VELHQRLTMHERRLHWDRSLQSPVAKLKSGVSETTADAVYYSPTHRAASAATSHPSTMTSLLPHFPAVISALSGGRRNRLPAQWARRARISIIYESDSFGPNVCRFRAAPHAGVWVLSKRAFRSPSTPSERLIHTVDARTKCKRFVVDLKCD